MRQLSVKVLVVAMLCGVTACGTSDGGTPADDSSAAGIGEQKSELARLAPDAPDDDVSTLVTNDADFAFDLYGVLGSDQNLVYSPHSISTALALLYPGAEGTTKSEMQSALHFAQPDVELDSAFNTLDQELQSGSATSSAGAPAFELDVANALWGQRGKQFLPDYLAVLAQYFGTGVEIVDFNDAGPAATAINGWVGDHTAQKITDLVQPGDVAGAAMVLTNAIYFNAAWQTPFDPSATNNQSFTVLDGSSVSVPVMGVGLSTSYAEGDGWKAVSLPYLGGAASLLVILPDPGTFEDFRGTFGADTLATIDANAENDFVDVSLPRFTIQSVAPLTDALQTLGMRSAFSSTADLSGVDGARDLYVSKVLHQAFISVGELGTEAAAATAVIARAASVAPADESKTFDARSPFLFAVRDTQTKAVLFFGQVTNPLE